jgi:hypothetical protein
MTSKQNQSVAPPPHLRLTTKRWFKSVVSDYELAPHHLKLLTLAAESWDRCLTAREAIDANGITYVDRFGCPRARPEVAIERDTKIAFARLMRELDLDVDPPSDARRAPSIRSNRT